MTKVKGANADTVRRSVEQRLTRLRTDVIDVLQYDDTWYADEDVQCIVEPAADTRLRVDLDWLHTRDV